MKHRNFPGGDSMRQVSPSPYLGLEGHGQGRLDGLEPFHVLEEELLLLQAGAFSCARAVRGIGEAAGVEHLCVALVVAAPAAVHRFITNAAK
jgi:hypothetical protein